MGQRPRKDHKYTGCATRIQSRADKGKVTSDADYRSVVAGLQDCEDRYTALSKSIDGSKDSQLSSLKALRNEVRNRTRLEGQLLTAIESERQRIGQDLHDDLCQHLGATALMAGSLAKRINPENDPELARDLARIPQLINDAIQSCRNLARGLHPVTLSSKGLPAALEELAARVPLDVKFQWPRTERMAFEPTVALHLYRIAEESIGNAVKHSGATSISVELDVVGRATVLAISDDGKGFVHTQKSDGMGLHNMQYRANVLGAKLSFEQRANGGTRVCCKLPLPKRKL